MTTEELTAIEKSACPGARSCAGMFTANTMACVSEDIGLADPNALVQCLAAKDAYDFLGSPEGELAIVQATLYLATAPKSNAAYKAQKAAFRSAKETGSLMPPMNIVNAPTKLMKDIGYGKDYKYAHNYQDAFVAQEYLPEELKGQRFYEPSERGYEKVIKQRLDGWRLC